MAQWSLYALRQCNSGAFIKVFANRNSRKTNEEIERNVIFANGSSKWMVVQESRYTILGLCLRLFLGGKNFIGY